MLFLPGHTGTIFKSDNAVYWGCSTKSDEFLFADDNVSANRSFSKLVTGESDWNYMARKLKIYGATHCPAGVDEKREWASSSAGG